MQDVSGQGVCAECVWEFGGVDGDGSGGVEWVSGEECGECGERGGGEGGTGECWVWEDLSCWISSLGLVRDGEGR